MNSPRSTCFSLWCRTTRISGLLVYTSMHAGTGRCFNVSPRCLVSYSLRQSVGQRVLGSGRRPAVCRRRRSLSRGLQITAHAHAAWGRITAVVVEQAYNYQPNIDDNYCHADGHDPLAADSCTIQLILEMPSNVHVNCANLYSPK